MGIAAELELSTLAPNLTSPSSPLVSEGSMHMALHKGLLQQVFNHI